MCRSDTLRRYRQNIKQRALQLIGRQCIWCGSEAIEAAHVKPTKLSISLRFGRGMVDRWQDVVRHPECYRPMCRKHNRLYDTLVRDLMETAREVLTTKSRKDEIPF